MVSMETLFVHAYHAIGRIIYLAPKTKKYFLMCWKGMNILVAILRASALKLFMDAGKDFKDHPGSGCSHLGQQPMISATKIFVIPEAKQGSSFIANLLLKYLVC